MKTSLAFAAICLCSVLASASANLRGAPRELRRKKKGRVPLKASDPRWTARVRADGKCGPRVGWASCDPTGDAPCCNYHKKTAKCGATRRFCNSVGKRAWGASEYWCTRKRAGR